jgi:uncharacterized repeat protein (TIGR01451 family)
MKRLITYLAVLAGVLAISLPLAVGSANEQNPLQLSHIPGPCDGGVEIRKEAEGPDTRTVASGSDVTFEIEVSNPCDHPLTDVVVTDALTPDCDRNIGTLAAGASVVYTCTALNVTASFTNVANVSGIFTGDEGQSQRTDSDPSTVEIISQPGDGGEGCTPGYWKQSQHFDSWTGYTPDQTFSSVFGRVITVDLAKQQTADDPTLLQALKANGGGINALARHSVAALLNAASADVDYAFTEAEVISMVQNAIDGGDLEDAKNTLAAENELGCPLS